MTQEIKINLKKFMKKDKEQELASSYEQWHKLIKMKSLNLPVDINQFIKQKHIPLLQKEETQIQNKKQQTQQPTNDDILKEVLNMKSKLQKQNLFDEISEETDSQLDQPIQPSYK